MAQTVRSEVFWFRLIVTILFMGFWLILSLASLGHVFGRFGSSRGSEGNSLLYVYLFDTEESANLGSMNKVKTVCVPQKDSGVNFIVFNYRGNKHNADT